MSTASDTPIYVDAIREAKRRTKRNSPERAVLVEMDERTAPPRATPLRKKHVSPVAIHHRTLGPGPSGFPFPIA